MMTGLGHFSHIALLDHVIHRTGLLQAVSPSEKHVDEYDRCLEDKEIGAENQFSQRTFSSFVCVFAFSLQTASHLCVCG